MSEKYESAITERSEFEASRDAVSLRLRMAEQAFGLCNVSKLAFDPAELYQQASDELALLDSLGVQNGWLPPEVLRRA